MQSNQQEYRLLKIINKHINQYFASPENSHPVRSTDIYEFLKNKPDFNTLISSSVEFNRFLRKMYHNGILLQFIKNITIDTANPNFYQWYFYPPPQIWIEETAIKTEEAANPSLKYSKLFDSQKIHIASNGIGVRSKEELNIMNRLLSIEIFDVYYERPITIQGKKIFPDFTIYNKTTNTLFYWEHFGVLNNTKYDDSMIKKIELYQQIDKSIDEGGGLIFSVYQDEEHFIGLINNTIEKMKLL